MKLYIIFLTLGICIVSPLEIDSNLHLNQLRFPWGVNFKYHGQLHHNLARIWVVTKFSIPPINKFYFFHAPMTPDCDFNISSEDLNQTQRKYSRKRESFTVPPNPLSLTNTYYNSKLRRMCEHSLPLFSLIQQREQFNRDHLIKLVEEDLYGTLQNLKESNRRKRSIGLVVSAMTGLVTLAIEAVGSYLQRKRNKAMATAMDVLHEVQLDTYDKLQRHRKDHLLYGTYSMKSKNAVLNTLQGMYSNQASLSNSVMDLDDRVWPILYSSGAGTSLYSSHLTMHAFTMAHRVDFLYQILTEKIQNLIKGIATLSKGYLPPELFPPSFLRNILTRVTQELHRDHLSYRLAFQHESAYYDMPLATFSLDNNFNIVVTFPIFIVLFNHAPLSLFKIETVPVPIADLDPKAQSYSEIRVQKPYFPTSESSYIQLRDPELFRCKVVQDEYYCEETFMVKHSHHHTCESALYYNRSADLIVSKCPFSFYHNHTVTPSMLDGGDYLVLANVPVKHSPTCDPKKFTSLPKGTYSLTNHDILCSCTLQAKLAYLPSDLAASNDTPTMVHFEERPNIAFDTIFNDLFKEMNPPSPHREAQKPNSEQADFPLNLTLPYNTSESIDSLKQLYSAFTQNLSTRENSDTSSYVLSQEYHGKLHQVQTLIQKQEDHILGDLDSKFCSFLAFLFSLLNMLVSGVMIKKFERLQTITASLTLLRTAKAMSLQQLFNPGVSQFTEDPMQAEFICYDPIISGVLTGISTLSVIIVIWQQWKNKNLCCGYLYSNLFEIKLILGEDTPSSP